MAPPPLSESKSPSAPPPIQPQQPATPATELPITTVEAEYIAAPQPIKAEEPPSNIVTQTEAAVAVAEPEEVQSDPSLLSLPPVPAPASAPHIDPTLPGVLPDRTSVYDVDMINLAEKSWRRPGSDITDWFNYGFDEISWEAYCIRRRELGEAAAMLKGAVLVSFCPAVALR